MTWSDNRAFFATFSATLLAVVALAVSVGMFGVSEAAAGLPPTVDGAVESFAPGSPEEPLPDEPLQSAEPSVEPSGG